MADLALLRHVMTTKGLTRRTDTLGEVWSSSSVSVLVGANEIVITHHDQAGRQPRFNRAAGGLLLAVEHINSL